MSIFPIFIVLMWTAKQGYAAVMQISPQLVTEAGANAPAVKMTCALPNSQATANIFTVLNVNIERATDDGKGFVTIASKLGDQPAVLNISNQDVLERHPNVSGGSHIGDKSAPNVFELSLLWKPGTIRCEDAKEFKCIINYFEKDSNGQYQRITVDDVSTLYVHSNLTDLELSANVNGNTIDIPPGGVSNINGLQPGDILELICSGNIGPNPNAAINWFYNSPIDGTNMVSNFVPSANDTVTQSVAGNFSDVDCLYTKTSTLRYEIQDSDLTRTDNLGFRCGTATTLPNSQPQIVWSGSASLDLTTTTTSTTTTTTTTTPTPPTTVLTTIASPAATTAATTVQSAFVTTEGPQPIATTPPKDQGPVCLSCNAVSQPRHCHTVERCLPDQQCGIDLTVDRFGDVYYDVGCKNTDTCKTKRAGGFACSECCNTDLCNVQGCGEAGYPELTGPICFACDLLPSGRFCHKIDICEKHEACSFVEVKEFGDILVTTGCRSAQTCRELTGGSEVPALVGKRSEDNMEDEEDGRQFYPSCLHCCDSDVCNTQCLNSTCVDTTSACPQLIETNNICADQSTAITCPRSCGLCAVPVQQATEAVAATTTVTTAKQTSMDSTTTTMAATTTTMAATTVTMAATTTTTIAATTTTASNLFKDCKDIHTRNSTAPSGQYEISVDIAGQSTLLPVWCDMTSNGGGWTVFQKRFDGSVDFYRNMTDYINGFGNINGEYWLGLDKLYELTKGQTNELMVDVTDYTDGESFESFGSFSVGQGPDYTLHLKDRLGGTALGRLTDYDGNSFSTLDNDKDTSSNSSCAERYHAGFWFDDCIHTSNINGQYKPGLDYDCKLNAMSYTSCDGDKAIEMKFRPI